MRLPHFQTNPDRARVVDVQRQVFDDDCGEAIHRDRHLIITRRQKLEREASFFVGRRFALKSG